MSDSPPIVARGVLSKTPLAEFLVRALDEQLGGTLVLQPPGDQKHAVLFLRGAPAKAKLGEESTYLSDALVDLGLVERSVAVSTLKKAQAAGLHHGQVLLADGHVDETALFVGLREQLRRQVLMLCDLPPETVFGLYKANYLASWGPIQQWRAKPLPLVWRALADHLPTDRRDLLLERLGGHMLRMRFEAPVARYQMTREELAIINMLRAKPQTLTELEGCGIGDEQFVRRVACALLVSRQLEGSARFGEPVGHAEPPESPNSVAPPSMRGGPRSMPAPRAPRLPGFEPPPGAPASSRASSAPVESEGQGASVALLRDAILAWQESPPVTLYDVLGVPQTADVAAIQRAFFGLARSWHPDRLPAALADLKPVVTRAFARMGEAHHLLSDTVRRADYDARLADAPEDEQAQVAAIIEASSAHQRAEVLLKKRDFSAALEEARTAAAGDKTQPEYRALLAFLEVLAGHVKPDDAITTLSEVVEALPTNVRVLSYRAQVFKRAGKEVAAVRDFRKILAIRPGDVDAQREIRVYDMRRRTDPKPGTGLLGKFLKKS